MKARKQAKRTARKNAKPPRRREVSPKIQRWIDLLAALLRRKYPATFEELAGEVPSYANPAQARDARARMFERDKDELRAFGVPIESVELDVDMYGYRIKAADFYLPYLVATASSRPVKPAKVDKYGYRSLRNLAFEPDELAVVAESASRGLRMGGRGRDPAAAGRQLRLERAVTAVVRLRISGVQLK